MKAISTAFFILWASIAFSAEPYTFTTLSVPGAVSTLAYGINDLGDVVGVSAEDYYGYTAKPFIYSDGQFHEFGTMTGVRTITPFGINKDGLVVGILSGTIGQFGFIMDGETTTFIDGRADSINNPGAVVGYRGGVQTAYKYKNGVYTEPVNIPGIAGSAATGINNKGDIVGYYFFENGPCCFTVVGFIKKAGGQITPLEIIPLGINGDGQIVGMSGAGNDAAILEDGVTTLIKIPGADYVQVHGINNKGALVGYYTKAGVQYGFVGKPQPNRAVRLK